MRHPKEKVKQLPIKIAKGFDYDVSKTTLVRKPENGKPKDEEKVLDLGPVDDGYFYWVDDDAVLWRQKYDSPDEPAAKPGGSPVTPAKALEPLRSRMGKAVFLRLDGDKGGLSAGSHRVTVFDWSKLAAKNKAIFVESHLLELAKALGKGWDAKQVPFALIGGESHPVPLDELDQQADAVLLVSLENGSVLCCSDPTLRAARPIASSTSELVISSKP